MWPPLAPSLALAMAVLPGTVARGEDPCAADVKELCPNVKPGSGRVSGCLQRNEAKLSQACRERLQADAATSRRLLQEFGRSCRGDVDDFCAGVEPGSGRVIGCLDQHEPELSSSCQDLLVRFRDARQRVAAVKEACAADLTRLCAEVPPLAGALLECLQANEAKLSPGCNAADRALAVQAASLVDTVAEMTSQDRVQEALKILQGIDSIAFSRSQLLFQLDSYQRLADKGNAARFLFSPQFVFGPKRQFALQIKVPEFALSPSAPGASTQLGLGAVLTTFGWNFWAQGQVRHYLALGVQWETASTPVLGGPWALVPSYAVAMGLARWVSLTAQVLWFRSVASSGVFPELNVLLLEPYLVVNIPGRSFLALDTKLGWDLAFDTFVPTMRGVAGIFVDRRKSVSVSAWYQASLREAAVARSFKYEVGFSLAYYFDW